MLGEDEKKTVIELFSSRGLTELSLEDTKRIAHKTGRSMISVEWTALDCGIQPLRYTRNIATLGFDAQKKLLESSIIIVGLGGLGGYVLEQAGRMGIGRIIACDHDVFEETNLNRQILSNADNLGKCKVDAARERVAKINDGIDFVGFSGKFQDMSEDSWKQANVVFDCLDNIDDRFGLAEQCAHEGVKLVYGAVAGWCGQVALISPGNDAFKKIYTGHRDGAGQNGGILPFTAATAASIMMSKAIKLITNQGSADNDLLFFDLLENDWEIIRIGQTGK